MFRLECFDRHAQTHAFSLPHVPNAIWAYTDFGDWVKQLPGLDTLHTDASRGLEKIILVASIAIRFKTPSQANIGEEIWPDLAIHSGLERGLRCPKIVFQISYPGDHEYAAAKAKHCLLDVKRRRLAAFILVNIEAQQSGIDIPNTPVSFEVWRRHGQNADQVQRAEHGVCSRQYFSR